MRSTTAAALQSPSKKSTMTFISRALNQDVDLHSSASPWPLRGLALATGLVAAALLLVQVTSAAETTSKPPPQSSSPMASQAAPSLAAVAAALRAQNPGTRIDGVQPSPVPGLYEVVMGRNVAYMDPTGRFAIFGHIWDMQARRDITADRMALLDKVDTRALDKSLAVRHVRGRGTRALYVFADPQCGFCKQQEQVLAGVDDVTIYTFVLPILGPESRRLATAIGCSADPAAAWGAWMRQSLQPALPSPGCAYAPEPVEALAKSLDITGTPTLVSEDGRKNSGAMSAAQLASWLGSAATVARQDDGGVVVRTAPR